MVSEYWYSRVLTTKHPDDSAGNLIQLDFELPTHVHHGFMVLVNAIYIAILYRDQTLCLVKGSS